MLAAAADPSLGAHGPGAAEAAGCSTLYFGALHPQAHAAGLEDLCANFGAVESTKLIKDKDTGGSAGYGFVKFQDRRSAEAALSALNGRDFCGQDLRVNWATQPAQKEDTTNHFHIFVGDLGSDVTDSLLYNTFSAIGQCSDARVMWDHSTGRSKGYGFVSFRHREDAEAAIETMQGRQIGSRRIRLGWAQHKQEEAIFPLDAATIDRADPTNTNVYVGNLGPDTIESDIAAMFSSYGTIAELKLHKKGGFAFVRYDVHDAAVAAIVGGNGRELGGRVIKCGYGKNTTLSGGGSAGGASRAGGRAGRQQGGSGHHGGVRANGRVASAAGRYGGRGNGYLSGGVYAGDVDSALMDQLGGGHHRAGAFGGLAGLPAGGTAYQEQPYLDVGRHPNVLFNQAGLQAEHLQALAQMILMQQAAAAGQQHQPQHQHVDFGAAAFQPSPLDGAPKPSSFPASLGLNPLGLGAGATVDFHSQLPGSGGGAGMFGAGGAYGAGAYGGVEGGPDTASGASLLQQQYRLMAMMM